MLDRITSNSRSSRRLVGRRSRVLARAAIDACEPRRLMASVSGIVFNDADKDGVRDAGDNGVGGVTVFADKNYDGVMQAAELRAVTDASGFYRINGIVADNTSTGIRLNGVAASRITAPAGGGHSARFGSDYEAAGRNFGVAPTTTTPPPATSGQISFTPFLDIDNDGALDAGEYSPPLYSAWIDTNRNGAYESGEPQLYVRGAVDTSGPRVLRTYSSDTLPAGTYRVALRVTGDPDILADYARDVTISAATPSPSFQQPLATVSVSGRAFVDRDYSGTFTPGDTTRAVTVFASLQGTTFGQFPQDPTTTSNADGTFTIVGVPAGQYVHVVASAVDGSREASLVIPPPGAGGATGVQLFVQQPVAGTGTISGYVFLDANGNGTLDGYEGTTSGVSVYGDLDYDGVKDAGEPVSVANAAGAYAIYGIPLNRSVAIRLLDVPASRVTAPAGAAHSAKFNTAYAAGNRDFFIKPASPPPTTTGTAVLRPFYDADGDGQLDAGEAGLPDATVWADLNGNGLRESNEPLATVAAGAGGLYDYSVAGLASGTYRLALRRAGDADLYADYYADLTVTVGPSAKTLAVPTTSSLGGFVYADLNGSGTLDGGDELKPGVVVFADYDFDGVRDANEPQTTTAFQGRYELYGIRSDNNPFRLTALLPAGLTLVTPAAGYYQARFDRAYDLAGQGGRDFVYRTATTPPPASFASVGGVVFADADRNGVRGTSEAAVAGQGVYADLDYDGVKDAGEPAAVTDSLGRYTLSIPTGPNSVAIRLEGVAASRITAPAGGFYSGKYQAAYRIENANFGVAPATTTVTGNVFRDANRNGVKEAGEAGTGGVTVFADYDGDGALDADEPSFVTANDGSFSLATRGGRFAVRVDQLAFDPAAFDPGRQGYLQTTAAAQVDAANASTLSNRTLGAVGARFYGVQPTLEVTGGDGEASSSVRAELARLYAGGYGAWHDLDRDLVRDPGEPTAYVDTEGMFRDFNAVPYYFIIADGAPFRLAASAAGTSTAAGYVDGVGGTPRDPFVNVRPANTAVFGRLFSDENGDGFIDAGEQLFGTSWLSQQSTIFADYDGDGVIDADEPSTRVVADRISNTDSFLGFNAYYVLNVTPGRSFTLRAIVNDGEHGATFRQTRTPVLTVAANTYSGRHDIGLDDLGL